MEIYVNVANDAGFCAWYWHDDSTGLACLHNSLTLQDWNTGEFVGTAFTSVKNAKIAGRKAKSLAAFDGVFKPKVKYYRLSEGKQVETKLSKMAK